MIERPPINVGIILSAVSELVIGESDIAKSTRVTKEELELKVALLLIKAVFPAPEPGLPPGFATSEL